MNVISAGPGIQPAHTSTQLFDAVVVGAGPYGLSLTAHLAGKGLNVATFGKPMETWTDKMPRGIYLRSQWWSTNLSDPQKQYGLKQFFANSDYKPCHPMPLQLFIDYGLWFQKHAVPSVDPTYVSSIERADGQFILTLADGRTVAAPAVVLATGPGYYPSIPAEYTHLPAELLIHTETRRDFHSFAGKRTVVIGGGQSALEWAAFLHEAGAHVDIVVRRPIDWLETHGEIHRTFIQRLRAPGSGIAPGWRFWAMEAFPYLFQRLPQERRDAMIKASHWPAGSLNLKEQILGKVTLHEGQTAVRVVESDGGVKLTLSDNTTIDADYVIAGTGYRADVSRLSFLSPAILEKVQTHLGSPVLNSWFESSVPGLYFVGFPSLQCFGPLYRFVAGAPASATRVAQAVTRQKTRGRALSQIH